MHGKFNIRDKNSSDKSNNIVKNVSMNNVNIKTIIEYESFLVFFLNQKQTIHLEKL